MNLQEIIHTKSGPIQGLLKKSELGDNYYSFERIPYAKAPIGELRFKAPVPIDPWNETLDASKEGPIPHCAKNHFDLPESEDCLNLNVYSKNIRPINDKKLPVIIYIYGGGFYAGSSSTKLYGPDYLMQKDVILVTFNYRLGPLGFLHFDDPSLNIPGNAGLKDQLLVLKWVQKNIEFFGGDKNNVTLIGHSAGAASVGYHMISESSKNLFHRAVLMSGNAFCSCVLMPPNKMNLELAKITGWNGVGGDKAALNHLMTIDGDLLMKTSLALMTQEKIEQGFIFPFGPIIETFKSESSFLSENPVILARNAWSKDIDIIIGYTSNETLMEILSKTYELYKNIKSYQLIIPRDGIVGKTEESLIENAKRIRELYKDFLDPQDFADFRNDYLLLHALHRNVHSRLNYKTTGKTFTYRFCYDIPTRNYRKISSGLSKFAGCVHGDDLSYIFTNAFTSKPEKESKDWIAVQKTVDLFTGFAVMGSKKLDELKWNEVEKEQLPYEYKCMEIDDEWIMKTLPEMKRIKNYDSIYEELH
uniref:Carboxylic ester hydrolase n=1 Tax=Culicoides sonorensis TaxID=179676 RepID=A0A336M9J9_CULSO